MGSMNDWIAGTGKYSGRRLTEEDIEKMVQNSVNLNVKDGRIYLGDQPLEEHPGLQTEIKKTTRKYFEEYYKRQGLLNWYAA